MGAMEPALQDYNAALALEPRVEAYNNRGNVLFMGGEYERAVQDFSMSLGLDPCGVGTHIMRGHAFRLLARYDDAEQDFKQALALDPRKRRRTRGHRHHPRPSQGDYDSAILCYDQALRLDSGDVFAYLNRGSSYFAKGDDDRAETDFMKALELDQDNAFAHLGQALVFSGKGEIDLAFDYLDRALRFSPDFSFALDARASLHLEKGNLDRAIRDFDKLLVLDPKNIDGYSKRGVAYERKGDLTRAMRDYDRALSIRPNELAFANRGIGLLRQSRWGKARSDLLSASNMGVDLVSVFRDSQGGVAAFQKAHGVKLPQDIADMLSIEEDVQPDLTAESLLEMFDRIRESVPDEAWDELPTDLVKNKKHYLYGHPKEED